MTIPIYGKLSDLYGRKPILIIGISIFLVGSVLSGLSPDDVAADPLPGGPGLGAGALFPISLAVIGDLFTPAERGKYQGLFGAVFGVAFLVGPFIGGFLTDNLQLALDLLRQRADRPRLALRHRPLAADRHAERARVLNIDMPGVLTLTGTLVPILIALTLAETTAWTDPWVLGWFALGPVFLMAFLFAETRAEDPIIPLDLFRNRTFSVSAVATFFAIFGFATAIIFLPLWFQVVQGASTTASGYDLMPFLIGLIGSSIISGLLISRTGRYKLLIVVAMAIMTFGLYLFTGLRADTPTPVLWVWMLVAGIGVGPMMAVFTLIVQNAVKFSLLGTATSDITLIRQIGTSVGLTVAFTLFRNNLDWNLLRTSIIGAGAPAALIPVTKPPAFDAGQLVSVGGNGLSFLSQVPAQFQGAFITGFHEAFSIALANSMWIGVIAAGAAFVATLFLHELPLRTQHAPGAAMAHRPVQSAAVGEAQPATMTEQAQPAPMGE